MEDMILERRKAEDKTNYVTEMDSVVNSPATLLLPLHNEIDEVDSPIEEQISMGVSENLPNVQYWHGNQFTSPNQFSSPYSAFESYSYYGDLMSRSAPNATFHSLTSTKELQDRCARLELENEQLKHENNELREKLERLSQEKNTTDGNIQLF
ncbi:hypothetical protein DPMN_080878 [Dreissena polymorpha]|uniref:Uncharacterized protein n=1 Tax=Dreissena polymorpha TaxID=45954 RepID=A0A9D3Y718_DREPO|nr:hypothetical protein DPMN_080878 [Dreissena polymorpha]